MASFRWIPLDGKKDPIPGKYYVVLNVNMFWDKMKLNKISINENGKEYEFVDFEGNSYSDSTHYIDINSAIADLPK